MIPQNVILLSMPQSQTAPHNEGERMRAPELSYYRDGQELDAAIVREVITPAVEKRLKEIIEEGEGALIQGSTAGHFLKHTGPIVWNKATAKNRSDVDINLLGPKSISTLQRKGAYVLEQGETEDGVRYEMVDGQKIIADMRQVAGDVQLQSVGEFYRAGDDQLRKDRAQDLFMRAGDIVSMVDEDVELAIMLNNTLRETAVGIRAEKVNGEIQYFVSDPLNVLNDSFGINDRASAWKQENSIVEGIPSVGMPALGIHRLIMHTVISFGHIDTNVPLALNAPRRIARLPYDETMNGIIISCDGICAKAMQDAGEPVTFLGANILGLEDFESMRAFLEIINNDPSYTNLIDDEIAAIKGVEGHEAYIRKAAQIEFARGVRYATEKTIFYYFSFLPIGEHINPRFNQALEKLHTVFGGIPQNTLDQYLGHNLLARFLPEQAIAARKDLQILENVQAICQQLYPLELVQSIPVAETVAEDFIPVYRQRKSPSSISEVMAILYVSQGIIDPSQEELEKLCSGWLPTGAVDTTFDTYPSSFSMDINIDEIRQYIKVIAQSVNLPHKAESPDKRSLATPFRNNSETFGRFDGIRDSLRRIAQFVTNA